MQFVKLEVSLLRRTDLSAAAKLLYAVLADRQELSARNSSFHDAEGQVFVVCSVVEVGELLGVSKPTAMKIFRELESVGLLRCVRCGQGKANRLYLTSGEKVKKSQKSQSRKSRTGESRSAKEVYKANPDLQRLLHYRVVDGGGPESDSGEGDT